MAVNSSGRDEVSAKDRRREQVGEPGRGRGSPVSSSCRPQSGHEHRPLCPACYISNLMPADTCSDMPALVADLIARGRPVRQRRAQGYWMDIGRGPDYAQVNADFGSVFGR